MRRTGIFIALALLLLAGLAGCKSGKVQPTQEAAVPTSAQVPPTIPGKTAVPPPPPAGTVIVDNADPGFAVEAGEWGTCANGDCGGTSYGADFRFAEVGCTSCQVRFSFTVAAEGEYDVWTWWPAGEDRATDTPFTIFHQGDPLDVPVDQRNSGDAWFYLSTMTFGAGESASIVVGGAATGYANADAVALTPAGTGEPGGATAAAGPAIQAFYAEPGPGEGCYTLRWEVGNASAVYLDDESVDNPGSAEVCPGESRTYTLRAENGEGSAEQTISVEVGGAVSPTTPPLPPGSPPPAVAGTIIIDHTCSDISRIPPYWLEQAKALTVHYAHTSHGSQIVTGLGWLAAQDPRYSAAVRSCIDDAGLPDAPGALRLCDGNPPEDYITPEGYWATEDGINRTRAVVDTGLFSISFWTWCGQQSENEVGTVQQYLDTLDRFEQDYPHMRFVYMTGHTDGGGDILARNNDLVRRYVREHGKVLFDFASFEMYDPAGNYYADAADSCAWCEGWCSSHPQDCVNLDQMGDCAHTHPLQCKLKAQAFWWMMARLAGWDGQP